MHEALHSMETLLAFMRAQGNSDLPMLASTLDRWLDEEAEVLLELELANTKGKRTASRMKSCRQDAEFHYLHEIREMYGDPQQLHHNAVIYFRRKPKAWAIATALRQWSLPNEYPEATGT
jgi:hypothetical protein